MGASESPSTAVRRATPSRVDLRRVGPVQPQVFVAVAHPVRRRVVELLRARPMTAGELADGVDLGRPAVAEHVAVLRCAGLVEVEPLGRKRIHHLRAEGLGEVLDWLRSVGVVDGGAGASAATGDPAVEGLQVAITVEEDVAAPPEDVWAALTRPDQLARWWTAGDVAPVVGHRFELGAPGEGAMCEVLLAEAPHRLRVHLGDRWPMDWRLDRLATGTRVRLEHSGFDLEVAEDLDTYVTLRTAWPRHLLPALRRLVEQPDR